MGLGFLCKYTALYQIICFGIFFALHPPARIHLRKPGPWLALVVFALCTLPVLIWNAQHGWITANHVAGNAGLHGQWHPTLRYFWDFILHELALLNPVFFIGAIWAMFGFWKFRRKQPLWLYFFCMGAPVFLGHWLWSFHSRILPNWIAPAILPMFCLMVVYWNEQFRSGWRWVKPVFATGMALGIFAIAIMYQSNLIGRLAGAAVARRKRPVAPRARVGGGGAAGRNQREKLQAAGKPAFIICSHYGITGLYSFYIPQAHDALHSEPLVYSMDSDTPENQFYFWPEYNYLDHRKGQNAIYVTEADLYLLDHDWLWEWLTHQPLNRRDACAKTLCLKKSREQFEFVNDLGEQDVKIGDRVFHRVHLWACYTLK